VCFVALVASRQGRPVSSYSFCAELSLILVSPHSYNIFLESKAFRIATVFWWIRFVRVFPLFMLSLALLDEPKRIKKNCLGVI
jgi:hypothetical protein